MVISCPDAPLTLNVPAMVNKGVDPPASLANLMVLAAPIPDAVKSLKVVDDVPPITTSVPVVKATSLVLALNVPLFVKAAPVTVMVESFAVRMPLDVMLMEPAVKE